MAVVDPNGDHIPELFAGQKTVDTIHLVDYLEAVTNEGHAHYGRIALPPIQRDSVWKPAQLVNLWDSLLRGMPVGSFLVARMKPGAIYRTFNSTASIQPASDASQPTPRSYFLLDGQQRTLTLHLGLCWHPRACLWLDLGQPGTQGRAFALRLTTDSQPFGFDPNYPSHKLSAPERRKARKAFVEEYPQYTKKYDHELPLMKTRPWKSVLPLPIVELWRAWRKSGRRSMGSDWLRQIVTPNAEAHPQIIEQLPRAFERLDNYLIPLILIPDDILGTATGGQDGTVDDAIETLYTRIGIGGTVLSGEEHIFSLIKHRWAEAHDLVHKLYADEKIGQILKPTDIVMTAVRLARADRGEEDVPKPRVAEFRRWLAGSERKANLATASHQEASQAQQPSFLETLQGFVNKSDAESSRLQAAFERFRTLIDYCPDQVLDPGLPRVFVPHLNLPAIQVVLRWIDLHRGYTADFFRSNRDDVLRFLLFWHIAVHKEDEASKSVFGKVKYGENFPGRGIYDTLTTADARGQSFAYRLPLPQTLRAVLGKATGHLRTWAERFDPAQRQSDDEKAAVVFLQRWWWARALLLWLQRQWVETWFESYDPLAGRDEDTPYDYDHILPRDHLLYCAPEGHFSDAVACERFKQRFNRDVVCNAIGNYRVWPSALNRGDGAASPRAKLQLESPHALLLGDDWPETLKTAGDLCAASVVNAADAHLWLRASCDQNGSQKWSYERIEAFQTAVEKRVAWLYERFYTELGFDSWA